MNEHDILKKYRERTVDFCSKLENSSIILEQEFISNTHDIYFAYPLLFTDVFPSAEFDSFFLEQLSVAGFLLYRSIIIYDRLTDGDEPEKVSLLGSSNLMDTFQYCKQVAFKILGNLFGKSCVK